MSQTIRSHQYTNGLVLVAETMDWVESAAFTLVLPAGCARDPQDQLGLANFVCEMVQRGCGDLDSRRFVEALDRLGADRSASVSQAHTSFGAAMLAENLLDVLAIYRDLICHPLLPASQLEEGRLVCLQEIMSLEDDLAQRTMQELRRQTYGDPWGRSSQGCESHIEQVQPDDIQRFYAQNYVPSGAILSVAGKIEWEPLRERVGELFDEWTSVSQPDIPDVIPSHTMTHIPYDSSQTQIGIAYPTVPYRHNDYFQSRGAVGVLSDGMSSRLFTEVRELRGLCYSVFASYHSFRDHARVLCYSGTSTERSQETLDVMIAELQKLTAGITEQELNRLKARVKAASIMHQESSPSRSGAMAADWFHLGRARTLDEVHAFIDGLTCTSINGFLAANPPTDFSIVTLGEKPLENPLAVS
ncbi:MAG: insulinase family protein [Planctomycetales bacterium]|nr:insulinase family protein [Planctomycetales bacterium]